MNKLIQTGAHGSIPLGNQAGLKQETESKNKII